MPLATVRLVSFGLMHNFLLKGCHFAGHGNLLDPFLTEIGLDHFAIAHDVSGAPVAISLPWSSTSK